jgi:hypothetical protein
MLLLFVSPVLSTGPDLWNPEERSSLVGAGRIFRDVEMPSGSQKIREYSFGEERRTSCSRGNKFKISDVV